MGSIKLSRRSLLSQGLTTAASAWTLPLIGNGAARASADGARYSARAVDLVRKSVVIDMLAPIWLPQDLDPDGHAKPLPEQVRRDWRRSGITAINHAVGISGPDAFENALKWMAGWNGLVSRHGGTFVGVDDVRDIALAKRTDRIAVIRGIQNSDHFRSVEDVKLFHGLGQRVSLLTYNEQNLLGSGSTERGDGGLSNYGIAIVKAMNEAGMLVDVSHSGDRTVLDAIEASSKPIAIGHANCRALNDHPRARTDEAIRKLASKGGVIGIAAIRPFVKAEDPTTIEDLVDHYDHVVRLVGVEHVGIGSDSDLYGYDALPPAILEAMKAGYSAQYKFRPKNDIEAFSHPLKIYDLTEAFIRRGYTDAQIQLILGGNFVRLFKQTWRDAGAKTG